MRLDPTTLTPLLDDVGGLLADRGSTVEAVVIGGAGLMLLGIIQRPTRDLDLVAVVEAGVLRKADPLPAALQEAIRDVARLRGLDDHWMNAAPSSLLDFGLPAGFMARTVRQQYGGLILHIAGRVDQVAFKLYATVDQGPTSKHLTDLRALTPSHDELVAAARWARTHDPSEGFRRSLLEALAFLGVTHDGSL